MFKFFRGNDVIAVGSKMVCIYDYGLKAKYGGHPSYGQIVTVKEIFQDSSFDGSIKIKFEGYYNFYLSSCFVKFKGLYLNPDTKSFILNL